MNNIYSNPKFSTIKPIKSENQNQQQLPKQPLKLHKCWSHSPNPPTNNLTIDNKP